MAMPDAYLRYASGIILDKGGFLVYHIDECRYVYMFEKK